MYFFQEVLTFFGPFGHNNLPDTIYFFQEVLPDKSYDIKIFFQIVYYLNL